MRGPRAAIAALRPTPGEPNALGQRTHSRGAALSIGLCAAIVAASVHEPRVLTIRVSSGRGDQDAAEALPSGPLEAEHRTLELGLRTWVERQTSQRLGYVEQLYTFGDRDRAMGDGAAMRRSRSPPWSSPIWRWCARRARAMSTRATPARALQNGAAGIAISRGRIGATASRRCSNRSRRGSRAGPQKPRATPSGGCARSASGSRSAGTARHGTRSSSSNATSCSTKPGSSPRRRAICGRPAVG